MAKRILVGTDGSPEAQAAVRWAARLSDATGAELTVARAWRPPVAEIDPGTYAERLADAQLVLDEQWCASVRDAGVPYRAIVLEGDPRNLLLAHADEEDADLVVVGGRGDGGAHPLHLGSVAHHLIHHTDRPLAVIPPPTRASAPTRIVVGVDGSPGSARAVQWCVDYGMALGAEIVAVYAELPLAEWVPHDDPRSWHRRAEEDSRAWAAPLREAGVRCRTEVVEHTPDRALAEAAIRTEADLVVVGTRGRGGFTGLRLGSTALHVLHRSELPVVLVPEPRE